MANIGTIEGTLRLRDEFTTVLKRASSQLDVAGKKMQRVGRRMSTVGTDMAAISIPILAAGAAAVKFSSDFTTSLTKITTLVGISRISIPDSSITLNTGTSSSPISINRTLATDKN